MGRSTLCVMSLSPEFGSIHTTYQNHSGVATPRKHQASDSTLWVVIPIKRHMLRMHSRGSVGFVEPCLPSPAKLRIKSRNQARRLLHHGAARWCRRAAVLAQRPRFHGAVSRDLGVSQELRPLSNNSRRKTHRTRPPASKCNCRAPFDGSQCVCILSLSHSALRLSIGCRKPRHGDQDIRGDARDVEILIWS
jgi:hypothetical protein